MLFFPSAFLTYERKVEVFILTFRLCLQQSAVSPVNTVHLLPLPHDKCLASKHKLIGAEKILFFLALQGATYMQVR